ncbi:hypothetical protein L0N33_21340, partial [Roseburia faecis]|nr:hypothetical protein [Roseburia faecis]
DQSGRAVWNGFVGRLQDGRNAVDQLRAGQVNLDFAPSEAAPDSGPLQLPSLQLPVAIELGEVQVGQLHLDGSEQLSQLQLAAHWTAQG